MNYKDKHWNEVFGNDVSAVDIVRSAGTIEISELATWLEIQFGELWPNAPAPAKTEYGRWASDIAEEAYPF